MKKESLMKQKRQSVQKKEAVLKAAMGEFLSHGYAAANMDRIATEAKVSKATVYSYFGDKHGLFTGLIEQLAEEKFTSVLNHQSLDFATQPPEMVFRHIITNALEQSREDPQLHDFMRLIIGESGRFPELAQVYLSHIVKPALKILTGYIDNQSYMSFKDSEATIRIMMGSIVYFVILQEILGGKEIIPFEQERLIDTLIELLTKS